MNDAGDIVFIGDLTTKANPTPGDLGHNSGVFLYSSGAIAAVAHPGDPMPGGGKFLTAGCCDSTYHLNEAGTVSFSGALDTTHVIAGQAYYDNGSYVSSTSGPVKLVARTGTVTPFGTILHLTQSGTLSSDPPTLLGNAGGIINARGQIVFSATMDDGSVHLVVATP
jgi:hypothetical protein